MHKLNKQHRPFILGFVCASLPEFHAIQLQEVFVNQSPVVVSLSMAPMVAAALDDQSHVLISPLGTLCPDAVDGFGNRP
jgi:hypothetical protein